MDTRREEKRPLPLQRPQEEAGSWSAHTSGPQRSHPGIWKEAGRQSTVPGSGKALVCVSRNSVVALACKCFSDPGNVRNSQTSIFTSLKWGCTLGLICHTHSCHKAETRWCLWKGFEKHKGLYYCHFLFCFVFLFVRVAQSPFQHSDRSRPPDVSSESLKSCLLATSSSITSLMFLALWTWEGEDFKFLPVSICRIN